MKGIVFLLLVLAAGVAKAQSGSTTMVGAEGGWVDVISATVMKDKMYTLEKPGTLYETDLATAMRTQLGKVVVDRGKFIFAANDVLYAIDYEGTMHKINPATGAKEQIGIKATWALMYAYAVCKDQFYTVDNSGILSVTDLKTNTTRKMGSSYSNVASLFATGDKVYILEESGKLHEMSPANGAQKLVSANGTWGGILCGTGYKDNVYMIDKVGYLYLLSSTGTKGKLGKAEFRQATFLLGANGNLYFIENTGNLYEIKL